MTDEIAKGTRAGRQGDFAKELKQSAEEVADVLEVVVEGDLDPLDIDFGAGVPAAGLTAAELFHGDSGLDGATDVPGASSAAEPAPADVPAAEPDLAAQQEEYADLGPPLDLPDDLPAPPEPPSPDGD